MLPQLRELNPTAPGRVSADGALPAWPSPRGFAFPLIWLEVKQRGAQSVYIQQEICKLQYMGICKGSAVHCWSITVSRCAEVIEQRSLVVCYMVCTRFL